MVSTEEYIKNKFKDKIDEKTKKKYIIIYEKLKNKSEEKNNIEKMFNEWEYSHYFHKDDIDEDKKDACICFMHGGKCLMKHNYVLLNKKGGNFINCGSECYKIHFGKELNKEFCERTFGNNIQKLFRQREYAKIIDDLLISVKLWEIYIDLFLEDKIISEMPQEFIDLLKEKNKRIYDLLVHKLNENKERLDREKIEREKREKERLEKEKREKREKLEREKREKGRLEKEKREKLEREKINRLKIKQEKEILEKERLEREVRNKQLLEINRLKKEKREKWEKKKIIERIKMFNPLN